MRKTKIIPRGLRNNNPLNIRIGNVWLGERQNPDDPDFEQFDQLEYGLRAGCVLLRRYIRHYHRDTIKSIIKAWAPASENNTENYIDIVSRQSGISPEQILKYEDKETICKIIDAMCFVECGQRVPIEKISKGYELA